MSEVQNNSNLLRGVEVKFSPGSKDRGSNLFADIIPEYNESKGYYMIKNPGWIVVSLESPQMVSYMRFLLWDNRGTLENRQASNRKYTYRLLIEEDNSNPSNEGNFTRARIKGVWKLLKKCIAMIVSFLKRNGAKEDSSLQNGSTVKGAVWTAIYENTLNPSNGWQEFYFEGGAKKVKAIKIQFFQNSSASSEHKNYTQLVSIQAYANPTKSIEQLLNPENQPAADAVYAPMPTLGFIRNRVIFGGDQDMMNNIVENEIIQKVTTYIENVKTTYPQLEALQNDLQSTAQGSGRNDIEKQIHIFNRSILKPIEAYDKNLSKRFKIYSIIAICVTIFGIIKEGVDIYCLAKELVSPLTISFWLDLIMN